MSQELSILGISAAITTIIQLSGFIIAYILQTETFYDILGGINFLIIGIYSFIDGTNYTNDNTITTTTTARKICITILFLISRCWLLIFLTWRAHERKGDGRFDDIKRNFWSFGIAWLFQGLWVFGISLPIIFVNGVDEEEEVGGGGEEIGWSGLEYGMIVLFGLGILIEIIADIQKAKWVKQGRIGTFCSSGIWKYSRHPNYFGEILQWWSAFLFAYGSTTIGNVTEGGGGIQNIQWWCSIISPLLTMQILLNTPATGVANANSTNSLKRYYDVVPEEYELYRKRTSILIPLPFGIYEYIPEILKRSIFMDFKRYEYKNGSDGNDKSDELKKRK